MVECYNNCTTGSKKFVEINKATSTTPGPSFWGDSVTLGIDIIDKSWVIYDVVSVELYDLTLGGPCIDSTGIFNLAAGESKRVTLTARMPSIGNLNLRVSVSAFNFMDIPQTMVCQDYWDIVIRGKDPSGTRYDCVDDKCKAVTDGRFAGSDCDNTCGAGGGGGITGCDPECGKESVCLLGTCVKRNDIFIIGAGILAFVYFSKNR